MSKLIDPQIYRDAANFLRANGWYQGDLTDNPNPDFRRQNAPDEPEYHNGAACINGALLIAAEFPVSYPMYENEEYAAVAAEVAKTLQLSLTPWDEEERDSLAADVIEGWNDSAGRTEREVLKALEDTAARLEAENAN